MRPDSTSEGLRLKAEYDEQNGVLEDVRATLRGLEDGVTLLIAQQLLDEIDQTCAVGVTHAARVSASPNLSGAVRA